MSRPIYILDVLWYNYFGSYLLDKLEFDEEGNYMKLKNILRLSSLIMLVIAIVFLSYALTHPESGTVFYIGGLAIGSAIWRAFYLVYTGIMVALFAVSFFVKYRK